MSEYCNFKIILLLVNQESNFQRLAFFVLGNTLK